MDEASIDDIIVKRLPSWGDQFGGETFCRCRDCRSIYSPAAYLFELLCFLDEPNSAGKAPVDVLLARRPDLEYLMLDCANTNTAMPYVDLINYVLESLVTSLDQAKRSIPAYDVGGATAAELAAAPQHINWSAYVTSAAATRPMPDRAAYPNSLPFDAALTATRGYLTHLGVPRVDLMDVFAQSAPTHALAAERLGMAPAAFELITGTTLEGKPAAAVGVDDRYGWTVQQPDTVAKGAAGWLVWALKHKLNAAGAALPIGNTPADESFDAATDAAVSAYQSAHGLNVTGQVGPETWAALAPSGLTLSSLLLPHVPTLLDRARLSYQELDALTRTRFLNPQYMVFDTVRRLKLPGADLVAYLAAGLAAPSKELLKALTDAGITEPEFAEWATQHLTGQAWNQVQSSIVVARPPDGGPSLEAATLRHWSDTAPDVSDSEWLRLDQLIRLWRATGWTLDDLDLALTALGADQLTEGVVSGIARIADLAAALDLSIPQVVLLWADLDPSWPESLYHRRFRNPASMNRDADFTPDWKGCVLNDKKPAQKPGITLGAKMSSLQAGLRVGDTDFAALLDALTLNDNSPVGAAEVSAMLRHVTLARALGLNVRDLLTLLNVTESPVSTTGQIGRILAVPPPGLGPWPMREFSADVEGLGRSDLNAAQLADITADVTTPKANPVREGLLAGLGEQVKAIADDLEPSGEHGDALMRRVVAALNVPGPLVEAVLQILTGTDQAGATLANHPNPAPVIPQEWAARVRYQPLDLSLTVTGALTDSERDTVEGFTTDAGWAAAVGKVHAVPRATLAQLAAILQDVHIVAPTAADLLADPLADDPKLPEQRDSDISARLQLLLDVAVPEARRRAQQALVTQTLLTVVPDAAMLTALLTDYRPEPGLGGQRVPVLPADDATKPLMTDLLNLAQNGITDAARRAYDLLQRVQQLADGFNLTGPDMRVLTAHVVALRADPAHLLGYPEVRLVSAYARCRAQLVQADPRLAELWSVPEAEAASTFAEMLHGTTDLVSSLMTEMNVARLRDPVILERVLAAANLVTKLGVPVATVGQWASGPVTPDAVEQLEQTVKARYDAAAWLDVAKSLNDPLRDSRRAALVDYLVARLNTLSSRDAAGLYEQLLIDVEMAPCTMTSPVRLAISTVQTFVGQVLLNLVPQVSPAAIDQTQWQYLQSQTVWAASREVLIDPENYLLPELRDDKSPAFLDLEAALLSQDCTEEVAERAIAEYLEKMDATAKLDVTALHVQRDFASDEKLQTVVHVFGRTANTPQTYYYRRFEITDAGTEGWTPWEAVPVDVRGDVVAAVTFERRLYLFWAQLNTKAHEPPPGSSAPQPVKLYQEVQLCWSEYRNRAWGPKHVTDPTYVLKDEYWEGTDAGFGPSAQFTRLPKGVVNRLETNIEGNRLRVLCIEGQSIRFSKGFESQATPEVTPDGYPIAPGNAGHTQVLGTFVLNGCHGELRAVDKQEDLWITSGAILRAPSGRLEIKALSVDKPISASLVLGKATDVRLGEERWIHYGRDYFVFSDAERAYFGKLSTPGKPIPEYLVDANRIHPVVAVNATLEKGAFDSGLDKTPYLVDAKNDADATGQPWRAASAAFAGILISTPGASVAEIPGPTVVTAGGDDWRDSQLVKDSEIHGVIADIVADMGVNFGRHTEATITFETFYDPFSCTYLKRLHQYGVAGLLTLANQQLKVKPGFAKYQPTPVVQAPLPTDAVDFGYTAPGVYRANAAALPHRELFIEIPMLLQKVFRANNRLEEALRCLRYVWDFTEPNGQYWRAEPLRITPKQSVQDWLDRLGAGDADMKRQIAEWRQNPFQPHLLARMRPAAYKRYVVMETIETLLEWGDDHYRRDTVESIGRATQCYVMAGHLSPNMEQIDCNEPEPMNFHSMRGLADALGNVAAEFENTFPTMATSTVNANPPTTGLLGVTRTRYFCVPANQKLLGYRDLVADRLFKIRNCMNIEGVVRQLPLFEKRIDPALLVRAAAQGIDIQAVIAEASAPLPNQHFSVVLRRAFDACAAVCRVGSLLSGLYERGDAEALAALNAGNATAALKATLEIHKVDEKAAAARIAALQASREVPAERFRYYNWLRGADGAVPNPGETAATASYGPKPQSNNGAWLIQEEINELNASHSARDWQVRASTMSTLAGLSHYIPGFEIHTIPMGTGVSVKMAFGGDHVGPALNAVATHLTGLANQDQYAASQAGKMAQHIRRGQDFAANFNAAALELARIDKDVTVEEIGREVKRLQREQTEKLIAQAEAVEAFLDDKFTNTKLYRGWMQPKVSSLYYQYYTLAYDLAKQAERLHNKRYGPPESAIIEPTWDPAHKGLLAGEQLELKLRQLERADADRDVREFELVKSISLLQLDPMALIKLKVTGRAEFDIPEWIYDFDHPGHYQRRMKAMSLTIPAVVGPDQSVNATLTLLRSEIRIKPGLAPGGTYERNLEEEDNRFVDELAAVPQIATSTGQDDSGVFQRNFADDKFLPLENAGAACRVRIDLDPDCNPYEWTDIKLRTFYTARPGGDLQRKKAKERWQHLLDDVDGLPLSRLFSLRYEFPNEWDALRVGTQTDTDHTVTVPLTRDRFPVLFRNSDLTVGALDVFGIPAAGAKPTTLPTVRTPNADEPSLKPAAPLEGLIHQFATLDAVVPVSSDSDKAQWTLTVPKGDVEPSLHQLHDIFIVCHYSATTGKA